MSTCFQDVRYALRALGNRPLFACVTALVLALAIGANTTVFSVFNGFFLRPLPYPDGDRLVLVYNSYPKLGLEIAGNSIPDYLDRREQARSLEALAILTNDSRTLGGEGAPEQLRVTRASPSLFDVLQVAPILGRVFTDDEAVPGNENAAVVSHAFWNTRLGARPDAVGSFSTVHRFASWGSCRPASAFRLAIPMSGFRSPSRPGKRATTSAAWSSR